MFNVLDHNTCMASHSRRGLRWQSQRQGFRLRTNWNGIRSRFLWHSVLNRHCGRECRHSSKRLLCFMPGGWRCSWGYLQMHRSFPYCGANHTVWQWDQNNSFTFSLCPSRDSSVRINSANDGAPSWRTVFDKNQETARESYLDTPRSSEDHRVHNRLIPTWWRVRGKT